MERNSFVFYRSFYEALEDLDDDDRLACFDAICRYALHGEEPAGKGVASAVLKMARPAIDRNNEKYENGRRGGRPKKTSAEPAQNLTETELKPTRNLSETEPKPYVYVYENEDVYEGNKNKRFRKPTVDEVRAYCTERGNRIDPEAFVAFYEANGWKVGGKTPMRNWKAAVITWEKREGKAATKPAKKTAFSAFENQHTYNFEELAGILSRPAAVE